MMNCSQKILVVDDSLRNLELMEEMLSELNVQVLKAKNATEAMAFLESGDISLAFLDVQMPVVSGYELASMIHDSPKNRLLPVIFVTAIFQDDYHVNKGYETGAVDYIAKPVASHVIKSKAKVFLELDKQHKLLSLQKNEILRQKHLIDTKNKDVTDSIKYARRIQSAILPHPDEFKNALQDSFIFYKAKDIIGGDFYWIKRRFNQLFVAAVDCTGHGVPGALLSIVGMNELNRASESSVRPHETLNNLNIRVYETLHYQYESSDVLDGMDMSLCFFDFEEMTMEYAGAFNSVYHIRNNKLLELKGNKFSIGTSLKPDIVFTGQEIDIEHGDAVYLFTDGYADQFGGPDEKKFKQSAFKELLVRISSRPMDEQKKIIEETFMNWKNKTEQIDDILVIGLRL